MLPTGTTRSSRKRKGERAEKKEQLTTRTCACSGKSEEHRGGPISPVTGEEEEDAVVAVLDASSIASSGTFLAAGQSFWDRVLGSRLTMATGQRRGGGGAILVTQGRGRGRVK
jgi:hypothetical protein